MIRLKLKFTDNSDTTQVKSGGIKFAFFYFVVLFACINTGNNLIYLVFATLTATVLVSWSLSSLSLHSLVTKPILPEEVYAGEETLTEFVLEKGESPANAYSLNLSLQTEGKPEMHMPFIEQLERNSTRRVKGLIKYQKRGEYAFKGTTVSSNYPFGLILKKKRYSEKSRFTVFPKIMELDEMIKTGSEGIVALDSIFKGNDGGLFNVRSFQPGDDRRHLHWKATARKDELMVKEFAQEEGKTIWLHFNHLAVDKDHKTMNKLFEKGVSVAASLAYHGRSAKMNMIFSAPGFKMVNNGKNQHFREFLTYLATVKRKGRILNQDSLHLPRRHSELLIVVDPLNNSLPWDSSAIVLDKSYVDTLLEGKK